MIISHLSESEKLELSRVLEKVPSPYENIDDALLRLYPIFGTLPTRILKDIFAFTRYPHSYGAMLLKNLPIDEEVPETPKDGGRVSFKKTFISECCVLGMSQIVGEPVGYLSEKSGELIHNVVPAESGAYSQSNQGSKVFLNFHNDIVYDDCQNFHAKNPDFLILLCLRADENSQAITYFCDSRDICNVLDQEHLQVLWQPLFRMAAPSTYTREVQKGERVWSCPMSVMNGPKNFPEVSVSANGIEALSSEAQKSLESFQSVCMDDRVCKKIKLKKGDALLINNRKGLHARSVFDARFDGTDRWLQRIYVRRSFWDLRNRWTGMNRVY